VLLRLFFTRVLPLVIAAQWQRLWPRKPQALRIDEAQDDTAVTLKLHGDATVRHVAEAVCYFRRALAGPKPLIIDLSSTQWIDHRFFGLFLMLRKRLSSKNAGLNFISVSPRLARLFRLHGIEFLLPRDQACC
jgi:N-acetylglucosaminyldiphosphoundecaprenol N-acetyl-beta-D-mannosaminyltransferase